MVNPDPLSLDGLSTTEALQRISVFVDGAMDRSDDPVIDQAMAMCDALVCSRQPGPIPPHVWFRLLPSLREGLSLPVGR